MSNSTLRIPSYRRHKPSGQAVVSIGGRDVYLGKWNSAASRAEYNRIIAEWTAQGGTLPQNTTSDFTVAELLAAFEQHAKRILSRTRTASRQPKLANYRPVMRPIENALRLERPLRLRTDGIESGSATHDRRASSPASPSTRQINRIAAYFQVGQSENELVAPTVLQAIASRRRIAIRPKRCPRNRGRQARAR